MSANKVSNLHRYYLTLMMAMCLNILPIPVFLKSLNPDWVLLTLIYWTIAMPERVGIFNAWFVGIFVDVLTGRLLGLHGLAYILVSYSCLIFYKRLRQYPVAQQALFVFFCLLLSQILVFWIERIQGTEYNYEFWWPVFTGTLCWPLVYFTARFIRISQNTS